MIMLLITFSKDKITLILGDDEPDTEPASSVMRLSVDGKYFFFFSFTAYYIITLFYKVIIIYSLLFTKARLLYLSDIDLYGFCPERDTFYGVVCEICNSIVKPQALIQHMGKLINPYCIFILNTKALI
jgi:hypothetical protein